MLTIGNQAPSFTLFNQDNQSISLHDYLGKSIILYFYPKDNTPGCTIQAKEFTEQLAMFESLSTVILGISKDSVTSHQSFCTKHNLKITLLSDPDGTVCTTYGVWQEKKSFGKTYLGIVRSTFMIDPNGIIRKIWSPVKVKGHTTMLVNEAQTIAH